MGFIYIIDATDVSDEAIDSVETYDSSFKSPSVNETLVTEDESQSSSEVVEDAEESVVEPTTELTESVDDTSVEEGDGAVLEEDTSNEVSIEEETSLSSIVEE